MKVSTNRAVMLAIALALSLLTSCKSSTPPVASSPSTSPSASSSTPPSPSPSSSPTPNVPMTTVTIYKADDQCVNFLPEQVEVPSDRPIEAAVGRVLAQFSGPSFDLSGYRVAVKDGVATVDLRLPPNSERGITSLSACEQFALFGSVNKTLTENSDWGIKTVRFTERGQAIAL